ncbi:MAG: iron uptake porin, partial [Pleurocapsa sp. MO_226.B13]|nr:iron uptake porin [Pleurocapsa sp. MO_226.B13]
RSLSERYNCINGFADGTFRGQQTLTRYQFAAGLNSCLQQIEDLIASSETVTSEDLLTVERLRRDFEVELATLVGRVDNLEARVATLEDNQFSTTAILNGEVIFGLADAWGGNPPGGCENLTLNSADVIRCGTRDTSLNLISTADDPETETVFAYLARLGLQASFSGQDRLRLFLTTGNFNDGGFTNPEAFNTYSPRFSYQAGLDNQVFLDILEYRVPAFNDRVVFYASASGFALSNVLTSNSPYFDIGRGAVSRFGQLNPIFRIGGAMDAGVGFDWLLADPVRLQVAYGTRDSAETDGGFFGADHSALGAQLLIQPTENLVTGITYVNAYAEDGVLGTYTGSVNAETTGSWSGGRLPSSSMSPVGNLEIGTFPAQINAVGASLQWRMTENLTFGSSAAYTFTNFLKEIPEFGGDGSIFFAETFGGSTTTVAGKKPYGNTLNYQFSLGFSDPFGREGDLFAFLFGMPPKLVDAGPTTPGETTPFFEQVVNDEEPIAVSDNDPRSDPVQLDDGTLVPAGSVDRLGRKDEATSLHFEFFYRFRATDNISITPGFFFVTNPGHIKDNDTIYVGTLRTTFRF